MEIFVLIAAGLLIAGTESTQLTHVWSISSKSRHLLAPNEPPFQGMPAQGQENCTDTTKDLSGILQDCKDKHVVETAKAVFYKSEDAAMDPMSMFDQELDVCSRKNHMAELNNYVKCITTETVLCQINNTKLPSYDSFESAIEYMCEKKAVVMKNETAFLECYDENKPKVEDCMRKNTIQDDTCRSNEMMATCMETMSECTDEEPIFATYTQKMSPERCGACGLSVTLTLLLFALLSVILN